MVDITAVFVGPSHLVVGAWILKVDLLIEAFVASLVAVDWAVVANLTAAASELVVIESETILAAEMAVTATVVTE